jgi:lipoprotein-releasing system permease protein
VAIALTTAALIVILSGMNGLTGTIANLYNVLEPDLKVTTVKGKYFKADEALLHKIKQIDGVTLVSTTLMDKALIKHMDQQALVSVKGVDENFIKFTNIHTKVAEGFLGIDESRKNNILLGRGIANQLQVGLQSYANELSLFSPLKGKGGSLNPEDDLNQVYANPTGIFELNEEFDYQFVFVNLETAKKLFDEPERVSAIEVVCKKGTEDNVQEKLSELMGKDFVVKNRYQLNDVLFKSMETEKLATFIILAFVLVIATFNIIGALTMLIIEKKKDIKTLHSMGASISLIRNIFMREGLLITAVGSVIGLSLGLLVCWLQMKFHLVTMGDEGTFIVDYWPVEMQVKDFIWIFSLIMLIGFFAALYPVRVFTKTDLVH